MKNLFLMVSRRLKMQGFIMSDYSAEAREAATKTLVEWIAGGDIQTTETVLEGFDKIPDAFLGLLAGKNTGKMLVRA